MKLRMLLHNKHNFKKILLQQYMAKYYELNDILIK